MEPAHRLRLEAIEEDMREQASGSQDGYLLEMANRLRAVIEVERADLAQAIDDAIADEKEACAKIAEAKAADYLSPQYATGQPLSSFSERFACGQIAEAIRARTAT